MVFPRMQLRGCATGAAMTLKRMVTYVIIIHHCCPIKIGEITECEILDDTFWAISFWLARFIDRSLTHQHLSSCTQWVLNNDTIK